MKLVSWNVNGLRACMKKGFLEFYQKREELGFHINLVAYLFTSVKNKCIDYLRRRLMEQD